MFSHLLVPLAFDYTVLEGLIAAFRVKRPQANVQHASVEVRVASVEVRVASVSPFSAITVAPSSGQIQGSFRGRV